MNTAGEPAKIKTVKVLLIAETPQGSFYLTDRLMKQGCECEFANSLGEAISRIRESDYDLVLCATRLPDGGAFPLMDLLEGSGATLFYFQAVEEGCWWLPGLRHGRKCFGTSALRATEFVSTLDEAIDEILVAAHAARECHLAPKRQRVSILPAASSSREPSPASSARPTALLARHKAAGCP